MNVLYLKECRIRLGVRLTMLGSWAEVRWNPLSWTSWNFTCRSLNPVALKHQRKSRIEATLRFIITDLHLQSHKGELSAQAAHFALASSQDVHFLSTQHCHRSSARCPRREWSSPSHRFWQQDTIKVSYSCACLPSSPFNSAPFNARHIYTFTAA